VLGNEVMTRLDAALSSFEIEDCSPDPEAGKGAGTGAHILNLAQISGRQNAVRVRSLQVSAYGAEVGDGTG
jgi:hypothetical protein